MPVPSRRRRTPKPFYSTGVIPKMIWKGEWYEQGDVVRVPMTENGKDFIFATLICFAPSSSNEVICLLDPNDFSEGRKPPVLTEEKVRDTFITDGNFSIDQYIGYNYGRCRLDQLSQKATPLELCLMQLVRDIK